MIRRKSRNAESLGAVTHTHTHTILIKINKNYTTEKSAVLFSILKNKNNCKHRLFGYVHFYAYS